MTEEAITPEGAVEESEVSSETTEATAAPEVEKTWRDDLPDELKGVKTLEKFKDVSGLAKSYVETEKYFEGSVRIPGDDASEEDWNKFYSKLGRPETPEDYQYEKAELPEGMQYDTEFEKEFLQFAHQKGLNNNQVTEFYNWWNSKTKDVYVQNDVEKQNNIQKAEIELRADWGRQYDEKLAGVQRLVDKYATEEDKAFFDQGLGNDPRIAKFMDRIAKDFGEGKHLGDPKVNAFTDPESAQKAKDAFYADPSSEDYQAYFNEKHPRHKEVAKMIERWNNTIHGSE